MRRIALVIVGAALLLPRVPTTFTVHHTHEGRVDFPVTGLDGVKIEADGLLRIVPERLPVDVDVSGIPAL